MVGEEEGLSAHPGRVPMAQSWELLQQMLPQVNCSGEQLPDAVVVFVFWAARKEVYVLVWSASISVHAVVDQTYPFSLLSEQPAMPFDSVKQISSGLPQYWFM